MPELESVEGQGVEVSGLHQLPYQRLRILDFADHDDDFSPRRADLRGRGDARIELRELLGSLRSGPSCDPHKS